MTYPIARENIAKEKLEVVNEADREKEVKPEQNPMNYESMSLALNPDFELAIKDNQLLALQVYQTENLDTTSTQIYEMITSHCPHRV